MLSRSKYAQGFRGLGCNDTFYAHRDTEMEYTLIKGLVEAYAQECMATCHNRVPLKADKWTVSDQSGPQYRLDLSNVPVSPRPTYFSYRQLVGVDVMGTGRRRPNSSGGSLDRNYDSSGKGERNISPGPDSRSRPQSHIRNTFQRYSTTVVEKVLPVWTPDLRSGITFTHRFPSTSSCRFDTTTTSEFGRNSSPRNKPIRDRPSTSYSSRPSSTSRVSLLPRAESPRPISTKVRRNQQQQSPKQKQLRQRPKTASDLRRPYLKQNVPTSQTRCDTPRDVFQVLDATEKENGQEGSMQNRCVTPTDVFQVLDAIEKESGQEGSMQNRCVTPTDVFQVLDATEKESGQEGSMQNRCVTPTDVFQVLDAIEKESGQEGSMKVTHDQHVLSLNIFLPRESGDNPLNPTSRSSNFINASDLAKEEQTKVVEGKPAAVRDAPTSLKSKSASQVSNDTAIRVFNDTAKHGYNHTTNQELTSALPDVDSAVLRTASPSLRSHETFVPKRCGPLHKTNCKRLIHCELFGPVLCSDCRLDRERINISSNPIVLSPQTNYRRHL